MYGRASRTRVDDRRTQIVGCGTGSCHRLSLGHAHEQEGGDLGGGGFQLILQENGFVHIIRQENFNVIVEIVTAAGNCAFIESVGIVRSGVLIVIALAAEVVGADIRDVNMDGALDCAVWRRALTEEIEDAREVQPSCRRARSLTVHDKLPGVGADLCHIAVALVVAAAAARAISVRKPGIADVGAVGLRGEINLEAVVSDGGRDVENCENSEGGGGDAEHY